MGPRLEIPLCHLFLEHQALLTLYVKCREMLAAALPTGGDYIAIGADEEDLGSYISRNKEYRHEIQK